MSVDTKLILCVEDSELAVVGKVVMEALRSYITNERDKDLKSKGHIIGNYTHTRCHSFNFETFAFTFATRVDGERMVYMNLGCSEDEEDIVGGKNYIIFSLGAWGDCVNIMQVLKTALQPLGDVYYLENDFDGEWEKI